MTAPNVPAAGRCPRCHRDAPGTSTFCPSCGAPLALGPEHRAAALDVDLDLDRRARAASPRAPRGPSPSPAPSGPGEGRAPATEIPEAEVEAGDDLAASVADLQGPYWVPGRSSGSVATPAPSPAQPPLVAGPTPLAEPLPPPPVFQRRAAKQAAAARASGPAPSPPATAAPAAATAAPAAVMAGATAVMAGATAATPARAADPVGPAGSASRTNVARAAVEASGIARAGDSRSGLGPTAQPLGIEVHVTRAEPWRRAAAWVVDGVPFVAAAASLAEWLGHEAASAAAASPDPAALAALVERERTIALCVAAAAALALTVYATLAHALAGATLGKRLLGIRVVGPDGSRPSPGRSALRSAAAALSAALLGLGFLVALFSRTGRALHDVACGTWVVKAP